MNAAMPASMRFGEVVVGAVVGELVAVDVSADRDDVLQITQPGRGGRRDHGGEGAAVGTVAGSDEDDAPAGLQDLGRRCGQDRQPLGVGRLARMQGPGRDQQTTARRYRPDRSPGNPNGRRWWAGRGVAGRRRTSHRSLAGSPAVPPPRVRRRLEGTGVISVTVSWLARVKPAWTRLRRPAAAVAAMAWGAGEVDDGVAGRGVGGEQPVGESVRDGGRVAAGGGAPDGDRHGRVARYGIDAVVGAGSVWAAGSCVDGLHAAKRDALTMTQTGVCHRGRTPAGDDTGGR